MPDREKVAKDLADIGGWIAGRVGFERAKNFMRTIDDAIAMLKKQNELLHKKQKDINRLCNEISRLKHKFHDKLPKEQEAKVPSIMQDADGIWLTCPTCGNKLRAMLAMKMDTYLPKYCQECGQAVKWNEID